MNRFTLILILTFSLLLRFASTACAVSKPPFMNLLEYRERLFQSKSKSDELCPMNLRIRPDLRKAILKDHHDYDWLVSEANYSTTQRVADEKWVKSFQSWMLKERHDIESKLSISNPADSPWSSDRHLDRLLDLKFYPGLYSLSDFASYQVGSPKMQWYKDR